MGWGETRDRAQTIMGVEPQKGRRVVGDPWSIQSEPQLFYFGFFCDSNGDNNINIVG